MFIIVNKILLQIQNEDKWEQIYRNFYSNRLAVLFAIRMQYIPLWLSFEY